MEPSDETRIAFHSYQLDISVALRGRESRRMIAVLAKYFGGAEDMTAGFSRTGQDDLSISVHIHARWDMLFAGSAEVAEAAVAFNVALEHVAKQSRWRKRALRQHKPVNPDKDSLI